MKQILANLFNDEGMNFPGAAKTIMSDFYIADIITGYPSL